MPGLLFLGICTVLLLAWHMATLRPAFDPKGLSEDELMRMEFNGDIVRGEDGNYQHNPDKNQGIPGPLTVFQFTDCPLLARRLLPD